MILGRVPKDSVLNNELVKEMYVIGRWNNSFAIHRWMLESIQSSINDGNIYEVTEEKLKTLGSLCETVLRKPELSNNLLPIFNGIQGLPMDVYLNDLRETIKIVNLALETDFTTHMVVYKSHE